MKSFPTLEEQVDKDDVCCERMHVQLVDFFKRVGGRFRLSWEQTVSSDGTALSPYQFNLPFRIENCSSVVKVTYCPWCASRDRPYAEGKGMPMFRAPEPKR